MFLIGLFVAQESYRSQHFPRLLLDNNVGPMTTRFFAATAVILALGVSAGAQVKPDFSGKWKSVDPLPAAASPTRGGGRGGGGATGGAAGAPAGFQPGCGAEFTVKQDAKTLTITRGGQSSPLVYQLDGSESKNTVTRSGQEQEQIATATWDGNTLVIVTQVKVQGMTREQRRVLSVEAGNLVILQTNPGRGASTPIKIVYKKG